MQMSAAASRLSMASISKRWIVNRKETVSRSCVNLSHDSFKSFIFGRIYDHGFHGLSRMGNPSHFIRAIREISGPIPDL
jgi:hypothetical protein